MTETNALKILQGRMRHDDGFSKLIEDAREELKKDDEEDPDGTHMLVSIVEEGEKAEWVLKETSKQLHYCVYIPDGTILVYVYDGHEQARFSMRACPFCGYKAGD